MRRTLTVAVLAAVPVALLPGGAVSAHGTMQNPASRALVCYRANPENPKGAACKAAVKVSGPQAFYDWNGVNIADAAGKHRKRIPDGRLCSAGNPKYAGLDLPRADWPATRLKAGAKYTFRFRGTAPHKGTFSLFVTKNSYRPTRPLRWSDLTPKPILRKTDPRLVNGVYVFPAIKLPKRTGRHLVYAVWQRSDSPEAFYSCSDVRFARSAAREATAPVQPAKNHTHPAPSGPDAAATPVSATTALSPTSPITPYLLPALAFLAIATAATARHLRTRRRSH
ncbi:hypothetical protein GCM10027589_42540 [Actinocorallia lasiicapitis]